MSKKLREIPPVDRVLQHEKTISLIETFGRDAVLAEIRAVLDGLRSTILKSDDSKVSGIDSIIAQVSDRIQARFESSLRAVVNATGVILHTNLGRAPLSQAAIAAVQAVASGYSNLEFDLESGGRGKREQHIEVLAAAVIGAESAMIVNNAASAVMLALNALASGREVIISRGQLVEIGGGFRVPDVMAQSGARLVEVGTTNRTRLSDYENAITAETALLMRAHASNFKMIGFTESTPLEAIVSLANENNLLCMDDLGSGALLDTAQFGLAHEPTVQESLAAGADVVILSGDKLLGGAQAGLIVGKTDILARLKKHPLARALRVDKMTIAALVATLDHYRRGNAIEQIPIWRMMAMPLEKIENIAKSWVAVVPGDLLEGESTVGGGSLPGETLPTILFSPHV
ncbi:MAG TPA: L-seryl-tRNA(Sec) selenium transferase, partial [Aggregatilineales bacterium]|nr:L-seryl-tRNA(Sec) selenium transferase [Aggregatilineales bacterium]